MSGTSRGVADVSAGSTDGTALVTGAGSGIGRIAARRLAAAGTRVAAVDVHGDDLAETAWRAPNIHTFSCDVTDEAAVSSVAARVSDELGPPGHVVHAAGVCRIGKALDQSLPSLRHTFEVNYLGTVHVCRAVLPGMMRRGGGTAVLFGSLAGWLPSPRLAAYAASKFAVTGFVEVLAQEIAGSGVRLLCVCPGQVDTPLASGVRAVDPAVLGGRRAQSPEAVLDSVELALDNPRAPLFLFPGTSTRYAWRARRFFPGPLRRLIARHVHPVD